MVRVNPTPKETRDKVNLIPSCAERNKSSSASEVGNGHTSDECKAAVSALGTHESGYG